MPTRPTINYGSPAKPAYSGHPITVGNRTQVGTHPLRPTPITPLAGTREKSVRETMRAPHSMPVGIETNRQLYGGKAPRITGKAPGKPANTGYLYSSGSPAVAQAYAQNVARSHGKTGTYTGPWTKSGGKVVPVLPNPKKFGWYGPPPRTRTVGKQGPEPSTGILGNQPPPIGVNWGTPPSIGVNWGTPPSIDLSGAPPQSTPADLGQTSGGIDWTKLIEVGALALVAIVLLMAVSKKKGRK